MNKQLDALDLQTKVGQLFMVGFDALTPNEHIVDMIKKYRIGNVILFARNIDSPKQVFELTKNLQELAIKEIGIPLFISIDQEGGMVTRIKKGATFFPGAMTISASNNKENAYWTGKTIGEELKALGINMNLAPSLDVNINPLNPGIGVRSYSDVPERVAEYGIEFINGLQENIIATAKHFPGQGDTTLDSHLSLPTIDLDDQRFHDVELYPFKEAIKNGVKAIMTAHIYLKRRSEPKLPATLSYDILTKLLRNKMRFDGLIMTDCMQMLAIQKHFTTSKGAVMALKAGADIVLVSHDKNLQVASIEAVMESISNGEINEDDINEHVKRVLKAKSELTINNHHFYHVKDIVINKEHQEKSLKIVKEAVTALTNDFPDLNKKTLFIAGNPQATTIADEEDVDIDLIKAVENAGFNFTFERVSMKISDKDKNRLVEMSRKYEQVIFCSYNANIHQSQIALMNELTKNSNTFIFSMRNPYDWMFVKGAKNIIQFYEYTPNSVKAVVSFLKGELSLEGKIPIKWENS